MNGLCTEFQTSESLTANSSVKAMERRIADKTYGMSLHGGKDNPWTVAAACIYMASHLAGYPKTLEGNGNRVRRTCELDQRLPWRVYGNRQPEKTG